MMYVLTVNFLLIPGKIRKIFPLKIIVELKGIICYNVHKYFG